MEEVVCLKLDRRMVKLGLVDTVVKLHNYLNIWMLI